MTEIIIQISILIAGLLLLTGGAEGLVRGSASMALRLGLSPLVVGLTVVAFGTSSPELFVSVKANLQQQGSIAIGNVVGSNIFNIAVILGISALIFPVGIGSQLIRQDIPILLGATVLFRVLVHDGVLTQNEGILLIVLILLYIALTVWLALRNREELIVDEFKDNLPDAKRHGVLFDVMLVTGGIVILLLGARIMIDSAVNLARLVGVSEAIIALTIVSAGTGLPELATSIVAALKKESDIAVGNIVGSNIFNLLCIAGITATIKPVVADGIRMFDLNSMVLITLILVPLMITGMRIGRREGLFLFVLYGAYVYSLWP